MPVVTINIIDRVYDVEERAFADLLNEYRSQNGLGPVGVASRSSGLVSAAAYKSKDMAVNNYFAHTSPGGEGPFDLQRRMGYKFNTSRGEILAAGYASAVSVIAAWKASPGHNAIMLGPNYQAVGIGRYFQQGSTYGWYWTGSFGGVL